MQKINGVRLKNPKQIANEVRDLIGGLPVYAMREGKEIHDEDQDTRKAKRYDPQQCGFALAAKRELDVVSCVFNRGTAYLIYDDHVERYSMPKSMAYEVYAFDRSGKMDPGTYRLAPVSPSQIDYSLGKKQPQKASQPGGYKGPSRTRHMPVNVRGTQATRAQKLAKKLPAKAVKAIENEKFWEKPRRPRKRA